MGTRGADNAATGGGKHASAGRAGVARGFAFALGAPVPHRRQHAHAAFKMSAFNTSNLFPGTNTCIWCIPTGVTCAAVLLTSILFAIIVHFCLRSRARFARLASCAPPAWENAAAAEWSGLSAPPSSTFTSQFAAIAAGGSLADGARLRPRTPRARAGEAAESRAVFSPQRAQRAAGGGGAEGEEGRLREALAGLESARGGAPPPA